MPAHIERKSFPSTIGRLVALGNALGIALGTLWANKLRSILTIIGIVIGVAAVVLVGATLGALREIVVKTSAQSLGANTFVVAQAAFMGNMSRKELADKLRKNPRMYRREAEAFAARVGDAMATAPTLQSVAEVKAGNRTFLGAAITGSTQNLQLVRNLSLSAGRFFTEEENRRALGVAVIGTDLADELFPYADPLRKQIHIQGRPLEVIGVQEKQGSAFGRSLDRNVYIPLPVFEKIWGSRRSVALYVLPSEPAAFAAAEEEARVALRTMRRLRPNANDNFDIMGPEAGRSFLDRLTGIIEVAVIPISSVALIVAGIVVMNMMLVSVTERTYEIGIRKSLGARKSDVLSQILFESTLLTVIGGGLGLLVSVMGTFGLSGAFGSNVGIPASYAFLALGVSVVIGVSAGLYPAYLASRMPPVEALRSET